VSCKSPIQWYGGKSPLLKHLLPLIPPHRCYVEPFGGAAWLLFAKEPAPVEVYNDIDGGLVRFFRVFRDPEKFFRFWTLACLTPYAREEFERCRDSWEDEEDDVIMAWRWFVAVQQSISVGMRSWSYGRGKKRAMSWRGILKRLWECHERFRMVQVEHLDALDCIERYDTPDTLFYADPPYPLSARSGSRSYRFEMTDEQHVALRDLLMRVKGMVILSMMPNKIYSPLRRAGWTGKRVRVATTACVVEKGSKRKRRIEEIWLNPLAVERLEQGGGG